MESRISKYKRVLKKVYSECSSKLYLWKSSQSKKKQPQVQEQASQIHPPREERNYRTSLWNSNNQVNCKMSKNSSRQHINVSALLNKLIQSNR